MNDNQAIEEEITNNYNGFGASRSVNGITSNFKALFRGLKKQEMRALHIPLPQ